VTPGSLLMRAREVSVTPGSFLTHVKEAGEPTSFFTRALDAPDDLSSFFGRRRRVGTDGGDPMTTSARRTTPGRPSCAADSAASALSAANSCLRRCGRGPSVVTQYTIACCSVHVVDLTLTKYLFTNITSLSGTTEILRVRNFTCSYLTTNNVQRFQDPHWFIEDSNLNLNSN
jgi:hypothetical protein